MSKLTIPAQSVSNKNYIANPAKETAMPFPYIELSGIWKCAIDLSLLNWFFSPLLEDFRYETGVFNPRRTCGLARGFWRRKSAMDFGLGIIAKNSVYLILGVARNRVFSENLSLQSVI
ncbi:hypothetical protein [Microcoleus sp. CAWBG640]|uniref:hypothetical protein n=1 Tax=Microcoleus sp. CAWBG640 TaxID=2841653 RepID=UPI00312B9881